MRPLIRYAAIALGAIVIPLSACADDGGAPADLSAKSNADATVKIADMRFLPADVEIKKGDTVEWVWADGPLPHNAVFDGGPASPTQSSGRWERSFDRAGTYEYHCALHDGMHGTVTVR